jgi:outer membrane protein
MKKPVILAISILLLATHASWSANEAGWAPSVPQAPDVRKPLTLKDCFTLATNKSESLRIQHENIVQSNAQARASLGAALPNLSWQLTDTIQDTSGVAPESGVGGTLTQRERNQSQFVLTQTLFSGLREYSATKGFKYESARNRFAFERASLDLFQQVATAFYLVLNEEARVNNTRIARKLAEDRVGELQSRTKLGKTRESEVLSAESQVATLMAQETRDLRDLSIARDALSFLAGEDLVDRALVDEVTLADPVPPLDLSLQQGEKRTDVQAQENEVIARRYNVRYQSGYYWPHLNATGDYYTKRPGFQKDIDWDVILALDVPLYQGGQVKANVALAASEWHQAQLGLDLLKRQVATDIKQARVALLASIEEVKNREKAFRAAKRSYELQVREYRLGLVNNLDVIAALNTLQTSKTDFDDSVNLGKLNVLKLKVATEQLP